MTQDQEKRILIIDGEETDREFMASLLRRQFVNVDTAGDGDEAIGRISDTRYSVILVDLSSMGESGAKLLEFVSTVPPQMAPIVLLATSDPATAGQGLDPQKIHGIIRKPFEVEEVAALIRACAEIKSRQSLGAMCLATMIAGGPILALLSSKL